MTAIRLTKTAGEWAPDDRGPGRSGAPARMDIVPLPAIDEMTRLTRPGRERLAAPDFKGERDEAFEIANLVREAEAARRGDKVLLDIQPEPRLRADDPEGKAEDPWRARASRGTEIAELKKVQHRQTAALELARETLTQKEKENELAKQALRRSENEMAALREQLDHTKANFAELLQKTTDMSEALDQRESDIATMRERIVSLKAELSAKGAGTADLAAAIEEAKTRYYRDFTRRCVEFETQTEELAHMIGARNERIRILEEETARLTARCERLTANASSLEADRRAAQEKLESQSAIATFFDATLQAERDTAQQKIAELVAELQRERVARAAAARESATVHKAIMQLLPKLTQQQSRAAESIEPAPRSAEPQWACAAE